jgi:alpha-tubulin suppressor-like RCC1 family protein
MPFYTGGIKLDDFYFTDANIVDLYVNGALWNAGRNDAGSLGFNDLTSRSSPIQTIAGGVTWKQVSCGGLHIAGTKFDGTLWTWGYNNTGQLGDNTVVSKSSPIQTIGAATNWSQVSAGANNTAGIKSDGTLWIWGGSNGGTIGNNTSVGVNSPVQTVSGGTNWSQVSVGNYFWAAIKNDGTLWSCGLNNPTGQLGDGTAVSKSSPVQTITGGTIWSKVSCGGAHTAAIKTDGTLWTWGYNLYGQLGDNTTTTQVSPVQTIAGGINWKQVSCGAFYTSATKSDGTLWSWGRNDYGQLGDNSIVNRSSPVQTVGGGTSWKQVSCGYNSAAIKSDGSLWSWGRNDYGQLSDNSATPRSSPVQTVAGGTNWKQVSAGSYNIAITQNNG